MGNLGGVSILDKIKKIHVAHLKKLSDRGDYIANVINLPPFKGRTDVSTATEEKDEIWFKYNNYNPDLATRINYGSLTAMNKQEICFQEQMLEIYSEIAESERGFYLILEDDFRLCDDFSGKYEKILSNIPEDSDCCFLGSCCNLLVPDSYEGEFWPSEKSRCGIAYTITPSFCQKLIKTKEYYMPADWNLTFVKDLLGGKFYWSKTILFNQGSEGTYKSNIR